MSLFGKKKEVVDLRPRDADMPIPAKMRDRLVNGNISNSITPAISGSTNETISSSSSASSSNSGGGFFGFFGGSSDSSSTPATSTSSAETTTQTSAPATDFFGNPVANNNNNNNSSNSYSNSGYDSSEINLTSKISKLIDRLELIEMKLDRLERKTGIKSE